MSYSSHAHKNEDDMDQRFTYPSLKNFDNYEEKTRCERTNQFLKVHSLFPSQFNSTLNFKVSLDWGKEGDDVFRGPDVTYIGTKQGQCWARLKLRWRSEIGWMSMKRNEKCPFEMCSIPNLSTTPLHYYFRERVKVSSGKCVFVILSTQR